MTVRDTWKIHKVAKKEFLKKGFAAALKTNHLSRRQIAELAAHLLLHVLVLRQAGAVAGVKNRRTLAEDSGSFIQTRAAAVFLFRRKCYILKMKAADEDIGLKPAHQVQDAFMRTAAEEDCPAVFLYLQVLFMQESIRAGPVACPFRQPGTVDGVSGRFLIAGKKRQMRIDRSGVACEDQARIVRQCRIKADVSAGGGIKKAAEGMFVHVDGRPAVDGEEALQTAAMIIMAVGKHSYIHILKMQSALFGVVGKSTALSAVKEDAVFFRFDIQAQTVLRSIARTAGRIFHQGDDLHTMFFTPS